MNEVSEEREMGKRKARDPDWHINGGLSLDSFFPSQPESFLSEF